MSPIDKVSDIIWFPRLGKIKLGIKKEGQRGLYPQAVDYFVCPEEVKAVHGDTPRELPIMFPSDDLELVAPQYYKCYSYSQGMICRGDGCHCRRKVDIKTGDFANKETERWELHDAICDPEHCPMIGDKQCRKVMSLRFILPEVPGLGVYQLDTSSFYSIVNINSQLALGGFLRHFTNNRIAFIPLILSVVPQEVTPPGIGRKTVHVLNVRADVKLVDIIRISRQKPAQVLLPTLEEEEPPSDLFPEDVLKIPEKSDQDSATVSSDARDPGTGVDAETSEAAWRKIESGETAAAIPGEPAAAAETPAGRVEGKPPGDVTEDDVPDFNIFLRLCHLFWKMQPEHVWKELGYNNMMDVTLSGISPWLCWLTIKQLKQTRKE